MTWKPFRDREYFFRDIIGDQVLSIPWQSVEMSYDDKVTESARAYSHYLA